MIFAHRGAGHAVPVATIHENTPAAFEAAIACGADGIELDLRRTADGVIVVHHDEAIKGADGAIGAFTVKEIRLQAKRAGYEIPTFEETLNLCKGKIALDIEMKEAGYEAEVFDMATRYYDPKYLLFTSFIDGAIIELKELRHEAFTGLLLGEMPPIPISRHMSEIFPKKRIQACQPNIIAPNWRLLKWLKRNQTTYLGLPLIVWTVDDVDYGVSLIESKIAAVVSDIPEKLIASRH